MVTDNDRARAVRYVAIRRAADPLELAMIDVEEMDGGESPPLPPWAEVKVIGTFCDLGRGYQWFEGDDWSGTVEVLHSYEGKATVLRRHFRA